MSSHSVTRTHRRSTCIVRTEEILISESTIAGIRLFFFSDSVVRVFGVNDLNHLNGRIDHFPIIFLSALRAFYRVPICPFPIIAKNF